LFLRNPGHGKINLLLSASMVLVFLGLGCMFIFTDARIDDFPRPNRDYIGYVLAGWGLFRGITVWVKYRKLKHEDEEQQ
jgi:hypothetical protein